jgi:hypothetical protein
MAAVRRVLQEGRLGQLVHVLHEERIGAWHFAHSYVRGHWHREADASQMLLAKACHDLDLLAWWIGAPATSIASVGRLAHFRVLDGRDAAQPWALAWSDEFDGPAGTAPDPSVWTPEIGDGSANGNPGWGNNERQAYTGEPANVALDGEGHLVIRALEAGADAPPCYYGAPCAYTSARIVTAGALEVAYGRIEARLKIPTGQGLWPAFWLLGHDLAEVGWPEAGEIDVMENVGREPDVVHGTIHGRATRAATPSADPSRSPTARPSPRTSTCTPSTGRPRASPGRWTASSTPPSARPTSRAGRAGCTTTRSS